MHQISPKRAMVRRAHQYLTLGALLVLLGLVGVALAVLLLIIPFSRAAWYSVIEAVVGGGGGVLILVGAGFLLRGLFYPTDNPRAQRVAAALARSLDYRYTFVHSLSRRGLGYIDAVLVGPNGALVFFFFDQRGEFICERNLWFEHKRGQNAPVLLKHNPTREVVKDVAALRGLFAGQGMEQLPVYAIVVLLNERASITATQPTVPVAHLHDMLAVLRENYLADERLDAGMVKAAVQLLMEG